MWSERLALTVRSWQSKQKRNSNALSVSWTRKCLGGKPSANPPNGEIGKSGAPGRPSKDSHLDAVIVGAVLLAAIALITMLGVSLSPKQKTQLTALSMGGASGLLVGYGVGRIKP